MTHQQPHDIQLENLSLQSKQNPDDNHTQDEFQKTNPSHDTQSTAHTVDSKTLLVPTRLITELTEGSSALFPNNTTITQPPIQTHPTTPIKYAPPPPPKIDT